MTPTTQTGLDHNLLWKDLLRSEPGPTAEELLEIVLNVSELRGVAWEQLKPLAQRDIFLTMIRAPGKRHIPQSSREKSEHYEQYKREAAAELLKQHPSAAELILIMECVPALQEEAWERLKRQGIGFSAVVHRIPNRRREAWELLKIEATCTDLFPILVDIEELRSEAWELTRIKAGTEALIKIIENSRMPSWIRESAGRELLRRCNEDPLLIRSRRGSECLALLITHVESLYEEAWQLLQPEASEYDLGLIVTFGTTPNIREAAARALLKRQSISEETLVEICTYTEVARGRAWKRLRKEATNSSLTSIIVHAEALREEAGYMLLEQYTGNAELECIIAHVPTLKEKAQQLLIPKTAEVMSRILNRHHPRRRRRRRVK